MKVVLVALLAGCSDAALTPQERARLQSMVLTGTPPADPTNTVADNPDAATLGQQFFFDGRFSGPLGIGDDGSNGALGAAGVSGLVACVSCHDVQNGGADQRSRGNTSLGAQWTVRNAPTVYNAQFNTWFFWDGRKDSGWSQSLGPVESPREHNTSRVHVARVIFEHYRTAFEALFGAMPDLSDTSRFPDTESAPDGPTRGRPGDAYWQSMSAADQNAASEIFANFGRTLSAYERLLVVIDSPFDRYMRGETTALSDSAVRGAKLFVGRAACDECHSGPLFADGKFHNHAIPQVGPTVSLVDTGRFGGVQQLLSDTFNAGGSYSDSPSAGAKKLAGLTVNNSELGQFKTPTLRNVSLTGPYMHTGAFETLWSVLVWYRDAAGTDGFVGTRDVAVKPLLLSDDDMTDVINFLGSLNGVLPPAELLAAPVLP